MAQGPRDQISVTIWITIPSFQLGTVTLAGWLVGGKSCLSSVACQCVCPRY